MGVKLAELVPGKAVTLDELGGRIVAVDAFNVLYQFLASIRQRDGSPLADSQGRVTSHLSGLFSRSCHLMQKGIRPAYVFDGIAPALKQEEQARRRELKEEAGEKLREAEETGDAEAMRKFASRTGRLTREMVAEAKSLVGALGLPVIEAPSEGEAQAAHLVRSGKAHAVASEDFDSLLFGAPRVVRHLAATGRRKVMGRPVTVAVEPELIVLQDALDALSLSQEQLIWLAMLIGTDYNPGGIRGIGPKKALKLVHEHSAAQLFSAVKWEEHCSHPWEEVFALFSSPGIVDAELAFLPVDREAVIRLMVDEHEFSAERIASTLDKLGPAAGTGQRGLGQYF